MIMNAANENKFVKDITKGCVITTDRRKESFY